MQKVYNLLGVLGFVCCRTGMGVVDVYGEVSLVRRILDQVLDS